LREFTSAPFNNVAVLEYVEIGVGRGPIVAGVLGTRKPNFEIVRLAQQTEHHGIAKKVHSELFFQGSIPDLPFAQKILRTYNRIIGKNRRETLPISMADTGDAIPTQPKDLANFMDQIFTQMEQKFTDMAQQVLGRIDEMSNKINELEQSIDQLTPEIE
jgi:heat shock factor-binding protein 1